MSLKELIEKKKEDKFKVPTNEEINSFLETYPSFRDFFEDLDLPKYSRKIAKELEEYRRRLINDEAQEEVEMEPNMERVTKTIMEKAINGNPEAQKLCVDMLIANSCNTVNEQSGFADKIIGTNVDGHYLAPPPTPPTTCVKFKELVFLILKNQGWTINDVKFSDKGNLESINIKFASEFTLGNSPWDPR